MAGSEFQKLRHFLCLPPTAILVCLVSLTTQPSLGLQQQQQKPQYEVESEILRHLFVNYSITVPPQITPDQPVLVKQDFLVQNIAYLSERNSLISVLVFVNLSWTDQRLMWIPPTDATKITVVPSADVWLPELLPIYGSRRDPDQGVKVRIDSNGTVTYEALWEFHVPCLFDMTHFPFDEQYCTISLGGFTIDSTKVELDAPTLKHHDQKATVDVHHQDWITSVSASVKSFEAHGLFWPATHITLGLTRKASYYYILYVSPAAIIMFLVPMIHLLPPGSHEKMTLAAVLLLSVTFMLSLVGQLFPAFPGNYIPRAVLFYIADMVLLFLSMVMAAVSTAVAHKGGVTRPVPRFLKRYVIGKLSFLCGVRDEDAPSHLNHLAGWLSKWTLAYEPTTGSDSASIISHAAPMGTDDQGGGGAAAAAVDGEASKLLRILVAELQYGRYREQLRLEWLQLALVIDRTLAMAILLMAVIITAGFAH